MRRVLARAGGIAATAAILVVLAPGAARACTCVRATVRENYDRARLVFVGTVASVEHAGSSRATVFSVDAVYKGSVGRTVRIPGGGNDCDVEFVRGRRYAVFARATSSGARTSLCWGTTTDVRALARAGLSSHPPGTGAAAAPAVHAKPLPPGEGRGGFIAAAVLLIGAASSALLVVARGRRPGAEPQRDEA